MKTAIWNLPVAAILSLSVPPMASAITPVNGGQIAGPDIVVNNGPRDQTEPHVHGDVATYTSYTDRSTIRYYRFSDATDTLIPSEPGTDDRLSYVHGNRIAFSRVFSDRTAIMVFDTASGAAPIEIAPGGPGSTRLSLALGGDIVVFVDTSGGASGDIYSVNLLTNTLSAVSTSAFTEQIPRVSPNGDIVVWEQCPSNALNCNIYKAIWDGTAWVVSAVSDTPDPEGHPDTDGTTIVYHADRAGSLTGGDIYFRPAAGGVETQLEIPGRQHQPTISSGVIAFESAATVSSASDIYVYEIATNRVFQVTNTPTINELLSDITVLPNGDVRVVWAADDGLLGDLNIYARTFTLPPVDLPSPAQMIANLIDKTLGFVDRHPLKDSLRARLEQIAGAVIERNIGLACFLLRLYIAVVNAAPLSALTAGEKAELVADANAIKAVLGCQ